MSEKIELGNLEFKASDFDNIHTADMYIPEDACKIINRILREKLENAELVFNHFTKHDNGTTSQGFAWDIGFNAKRHNVLCRVVAIKEIKKD